MIIRDVIKKLEDNKDKKYTILLSDKEDLNGIVGGILYTHKLLEEIAKNEYTEEELNEDDEHIVDIAFADKLTGILQGEDK